MDVDTPGDWVAAAAAERRDAPALEFPDGVVTYHQLADQVHQRAQTLWSEWLGERAVVGVAARLDLPSIVDILAHQTVGLIPIPYTHPIDIPHGWATDAVIGVATSGSSGERRLVPLTMGNLTASVLSSRERLETGPADRWLLPLPIDHVGGLSVLLRSFEAGGSVVISEFGPDTADHVRRARPTVASLVPTMLHRLLEWDPDAVASIETVLVGGGRLPPSLADRARDAGVRLVATYGATETSSQVATMEPGEDLRHVGFVGAPLSGYDVSIHGQDAEGVGIIAVDGPAVFGGYAGEPPRIGPHFTSDLGRLSADGTLTVLGRADDVAVTGGVNVALPSVADTISTIDGVDDVAVVAIDDTEWGAVVCALVETSLTRDAVVAQIRERLTGARNPRLVEVTPAIPLLPNGKHDRAAVMASFGSR